MSDPSSRQDRTGSRVGPLSIEPGAVPLEVVNIHGVRIAIDPARMSPRMQQVIRRGRHSEPEATLMPKALEEGERFLELGGGIGYTSARAALTGKAASVTTFEANPDLISSIHNTHSLNNVQANVRNGIIVARKQSETVPFYIHKDFWASSLTRPASGAGKVVEVPVVTFAEMMRSYSPTMLMVDIEGAEVSLFKDVRLDGVNKVLIELHRPKTGDVGIRYIFDFFAAQGFCYDPRFSMGAVVLFRRMQKAAARRKGGVLRWATRKLSK